MAETVTPNPVAFSPALLRTPIVEASSLLVSHEWGRWFQASWSRQGGAQAPSNADLGTGLEETQADLEQTQADLEQTQADLEQVSAELEQVSAELEQVSAELAAVQTAVAGLEGDVTALEGAVTTLQGQVTTLEGAVMTLQGDVTTLQGQVTTLEGQVTTLEGQVTTLQGQVTTLQSDLAALTTRVEALEGVVQTFTVTFTGFTTVLTGTASYVKVGRVVTLQLPQASGGGDGATAVQLQGIPAAILPLARLLLPILVQNGGSLFWGRLDSAPGTSFEVIATANDGFTPGLTRAVFPLTLTYVTAS